MEYRRSAGRQRQQAHQWAVEFYDLQLRPFLPVYDAQTWREHSGRRDTKSRAVRQQLPDRSRGLQVERRRNQSKLRRISVTLSAIWQKRVPAT